MLAALVAVLVLAGCTAGWLDPPPSSAPASGSAAPSSPVELGVLEPAVSCADVAGLDLSGVPGFPAVVTATEETTAATGGYRVCDVQGTIEPSIGFQLQLPLTTYRQRYLQIGCGGLCGSIRLDAQQTDGCAPLTEGQFVTASNDLGHQGGGGEFGDDPQLRADFAYRADHALAVVAKRLIEQVYGEAPRFSYFTGCSQGGHQALAEAQRYPDDFDGIVAGAPAAVLTELNSFYQPWMAAVEFDAAGAPVLSAADLPVVHQAVLGQCDAVDGLADGQLEDPRACTVDLSVVQCPPGGPDVDGCLTAAQLDVVRAIWSGPVDAAGRRLYPGGAAPGSELAWAGWIVPEQPGEGTAAQGLGGPWLEHLALAPGVPAPDPPAFDQATFDRVRELAGLYDATDPDLSAFRDSGGKLLMWHGWADQAIPPTGTLAYHQAVEDQLGGPAAVREFARLYMVPGMEHCGGGQAPSSFDALTPVLDWVERGVAPEGIVARDPDSGRTRPVFPHPQVARFDGTGSIEDASSFAAAAPAVPVDDSVDWLGSFPAGQQLWYESGRLTPVRPPDE